MLRFCLLILLGGILSTGLILYFSQGNLTSLFSNSHLIITDTAMFILPAVIYTNLVTIILISFFMVLIILFVSHKIAGPLFRLEKDINVISEGDLTYRVKLRKGDQLIELSEDVNQMTMSLNSKIRAIQADLERIAAKSLDQNAPQWFQEQMHQLHEQLSQNFKLGN